MLKIGGVCSEAACGTVFTGAQAAVFATSGKHYFYF